MVTDFFHSAPLSFLCCILPPLIILLFFPELETAFSGISAPILSTIAAVLILAGGAWTFVLTKNILKQ